MHNLSSNEVEKVDLIVQAVGALEPMIQEIVLSELPKITFLTPEERVILHDKLRQITRSKIDSNMSPYYEPL